MNAVIGTPFKLKFINNSNVIIELKGDIDISLLSLTQTKPSPYPTPRFEHMGGSKIKMFYENNIPCHLVFEYIFQSHSSEVQKDAVTLWGKIPTFFKTLLKRILFSALFAVVVGVAIYGDNKYNEGKIGNWFTPANWIAEKLSEGEDNIKSIDTRILTNNHKLYQSEGFIEAENLVNENLNDKIEDLRDDGKIEEAKKLESGLVKLKDEYWFLGGGLFVFKEVVTKGKEPILVTYEVAEDFCEMIGAEVISKDDSEVMNGLLVYLTSIFTVRDNSKVPEWTSTETVEDGYNKILMKSSDKTPVFSMNVRGEIAGDIEQTKAAFRCSMEESAFLGAD